MNDHYITHATFENVRKFTVDPATVFAAWADPSSKAQWFSTPESVHTLDFRVGGKEMNRGPSSDGSEAVFESTYLDIVENERIVYVSALTITGTLATLSLTSVQFSAIPSGTELLLVEHGDYLDGHEVPRWREQGTNDWLNKLQVELAEPATS